MTKLETLYASIKGLQDLGLPLNDETLKANVERIERGKYNVDIDMIQQLVKPMGGVVW